MRPASRGRIYGRTATDRARSVRNPTRARLMSHRPIVSVSRRRVVRRRTVMDPFALPRSLLSTPFSSLPLTSSPVAATTASQSARVVSAAEPRDFTSNPFSFGHSSANKRSHAAIKIVFGDKKNNGTDEKNAHIRISPEISYLSVYT